MKRAFKYRFYPTDAQAAELSRTFGCVRKVYNLALAARTEAWTRQERVNYNQTSAMLTAWKKTEELAYLNEVSVGSAPAGVAALAGGVHQLLRQAGQVPALQVAEEVPQERRVHHQRVPLPGRQADAGQDDASRWTSCGPGRCPRARRRPR